jgi:hypothetical protein
MTRTFLVTLEVPDNEPSSLDGMAEDIADSLNLDGFPIESVRPWSSPGTIPLSTE